MSALFASVRVWVARHRRRAGIAALTSVVLALSVMVAPVASAAPGDTWTSRTPAAKNQWTSVTYGAGLFVAVSFDGDANQVMTSPDGITWTSRTSPVGYNAWTSVTYGGGLFVAISSVGDPNPVMTSPDGITWTSRKAAASKSGWSSVTYGGGLFVVVGGNRVMTSPDGITWTRRTSPPSATTPGPRSPTAAACSSPSRGTIPAAATKTG